MVVCGTPGPLNIRSVNSLPMKILNEPTIESSRKLCEGYPIKGFSLVKVLLSIWVYRAVRFILAVVFVWSGISKLIEPQSFAVIIEAYGLLPDELIMAVVLFLPALELLAGIGLLIDVRGSLGIVAGLLFLFMVILGYGIWMGLDVDCGCFGPEDPEAKAYHVLRSALYKDFVMMAGVVYLYRWRYVRFSSPVRLSRDVMKFYGRRSK